MDARSFTSCLIGAVAAAQTLQPSPPVDPSLPSRPAQEEAQQKVAEPPSELDTELERPDVNRPGDIVGSVAEVDARHGWLRVEQGGEQRTLKIGDTTQVELPGRPEHGISGLVPGDDVRVSLDERGVAKTVTLVPDTRDEAPVPPEKLPRTNPTAPNPSAPEPWNDRPPGDTPGNRIPW